jgi:hypothetical protein
VRYSEEKHVPYYLERDLAVFAPIRKQTALDITLQGTLGRFRTGTVGTSGRYSTEAVVLQTHVGLDFDTPANEKVLRNLEVVRELFPFQTLDFDEIMQRDIDDTRVTKDLIPYLLDTDARGMIKFFPPIVVVVLPVENMLSKPSKYYPEVKRNRESEHPEHGAEYEWIRSGEVGNEAFQFEYPIIDGRPHQHDYVRLKLNSSRVRLVIIDGQHRAMALLALYRNLNGEWNEKHRMPFESYYQEWTKDKIKGFDLAGVQLPMIICTFPELDVNYKGDLDIVRAARRLFLTLNKEARQVTRSRNILLNDRDLISHFLRDTLGEIKRRDVNAESAFRIWNVELDQSTDRTVITSPMACTGVSHVYFCIEHMLLAHSKDVIGIRTRSGVFSNRKSVQTTEPLNARLDGANTLGVTVASTLRRDDYVSATAEKLSPVFRERFGKLILSVFDRFKPFVVHSKAALQAEAALGTTNPQVRAILFEGQNIGRTFTEYRTHMKDKEKAAKQTKTTLPPEVQNTITKLDSTQKMLDDQRASFLRQRALLYLADFNDKAKLKVTDSEDYSPKVISLINRLYDKVYTTVAFQAAVICGSIHVIEIAEREAARQHATLPSREALLDEHLGQLNAFFVPGTMARLKNLIRVFFHDPDPDGTAEKAEDWKQAETHDTFSAVVYRGEMKPEEWPKYRLPLLELWKPSDPFVKAARDAELKECREQAFRSHYERVTKEVCADLRKSELDLTQGEKEQIFELAFGRFDHFLEHLGVVKAERLDRKKAQAIAEEAPTPEAEAEEDKADDSPGETAEPV